MTNEMKQTFTLRISKANQSGLMVILCDMLLEYMGEAVKQAERLKVLRVESRKAAYETMKEDSSKSGYLGITGNTLEAQQALAADFKNSMVSAKACLRELILALPDSEEADVLRISYQILSLYRFCERELIRAEIRMEADGILHATDVIAKLRDAYKEAGEKDPSAPVMQNTETIYAGMTYGRNSISESSNVASNRGFFA